jgi:hypothetical protein
VIPSVRRELKYLITPALAAKIREAVRGVCQVDEHCAGRPRDRYVIDSLYLDGPGLPFYRAKIDRAHKRLKLRVRTYDERPGGGFLEVKRKNDDTVHKTRVRFEGDWREAVMAPTSPAAHDFAALLALSAAEPTVWVRYEREAWASVLERYGRVTFDSHIRFQLAEPGVTRPDAGAWRPLDDAYTQKEHASLVVLELKFEDVAPAWMASLVRRFDLFRRGYSKYCAGVDQVWGRYRPLEPMGRAPVWG